MDLQLRLLQIMLKDLAVPLLYMIKRKPRDCGYSFKGGRGAGSRLAIYAMSIEPISGTNARLIVDKQSTGGGGGWGGEGASGGK